MRCTPDPVRHRRVVLLVVLAAVIGCGRDGGEGGVPGAVPLDDGSRPLNTADPALMAACDSVEQWVRGAVTKPVQRVDGEFSGAARGLQRYGCRLTASDTLPADLPQRPLDLVWQTFAAHGWDVEPSYIADSPEGSMLGMRRDTVLCVLQHYWTTETDDERATVSDSPSPYDLSVECFREAGRAPRDTSRAAPRDTGAAARPDTGR